MGEFIAEARRERGLSAQALADLIGYSRQFIVRLEGGATKPDGTPAADLRALNKLTEALHVDRNEVYALAGYVPPDFRDRIITMVRQESDLHQRQLDEAFAKVKADPNWQFGSSIGVWAEDLPKAARNEYKREVVMLYEASTGRKLLPDDWDLRAAGEAKQDSGGKEGRRGEQ